MSRKRITTGTGCVVSLLLIAAIGGIVAGINAYLNHQMSELHRAVRGGDLAKVEDLVAHGSNVNERTKFKNWTPLHMAAMAGRPDIARFLIEHGADVNARDVEGFTPLHNCANPSMKGPPAKETEGERNAVAAFLIERGANVNAINDARETPLHRTVLPMNLALAQMLLDHGANPNLTQSQGFTALHASCFWPNEDRTEMTRLLLGHGADPTIKDQQGKTPLDWAKEFQPRSAELLKAGTTRPAP